MTDSTRSHRPAIREIDMALERMQMRAERRLGFYLGLLAGMGLMALVVLLSVH